MNTNTNNTNDNDNDMYRNKNNDKDNLYLKKYLKYKLKYEKIKGGGDGYGALYSVIFHIEYDKFCSKIKETSVEKSDVENYFNFMTKCIENSNSAKIKYVDFEDNFYVSKQLSVLEEGGFNLVFKSRKLPEFIYLKSYEPTYDFDEIKLLIYLNNINKNNKCNIFTPFYKIIFDIQCFKYYLEFKLYNCDLQIYLKKICTCLGSGDKLDKDKLIKLLEFIYENLIIKLTKLLYIDYLCLDIRLQNILISYETNFNIIEIVLHDFDMVACCDIQKLDPKCFKDDDTIKFMLIYYKLILFIESYQIIKNYTEIRALFEDDLKKNNIEDLTEFFNYFINENKYQGIPDCKMHDLSIKEKMHLYFNRYILNLIKQMNPTIIPAGVQQDKDRALLPEIFKKILMREIIL